jgi:2-oxoglutarate ferredoxin oxidoreductase subunit alpha
LKEDVEFPKLKPFRYDVSWATTGAKGQVRHIINSLELDPGKQYEHVGAIFEKYKQAEAKEVRFEDYQTDDAETVIVAFGIASRVSKGAVNKLRRKGIKVGLLRPITLWPFPNARLKELASQGKQFLDVELNTGQMLQDVKLAVGTDATVRFLGRWGGLVPTETEIANKLQRLEVVAA